MILERNLYIDENEEEYFKNHYIKKRKENLEGPPLRYYLVEYVDLEGRGQKMGDRKRRWNRTN